MKIKKSVLEKIVREELARHLRSLQEAGKESAPGVEDANKQGKDKADDKKKKDKADGKSPKVASDASTDPGADVTNVAKDVKKLPPPEDPQVDNELEKDVAGAEDSADVTGGKISKDVTGKTIQSLTMEPKSKTLPGAQEIVLTFKEVPDPLKILITSTGQVKFYYKSALHNTLGEAAGSPSPSQKLRAQHPEGPAKPGEVIKKTSKPGSFSLSNEEWQEWQTNPPNVLRIVSSIDGKPLATLTASDVKQSVMKARYMQGMAKGINSEVGWWLAPFKMGKK